MYKAYIESPYNIYEIVGDEFGISRINEVDEKLHNEIHETLQQAYTELDEYFKGDRKEFTFKLNIIGTDFQKKVWNALMNIPYGELWSYKDIATSIGNPKASRAVGMANNKNVLPIVIPCHRVVGSNGKLVGYAGGLHIKEFLINLEKENR